MVAAQVAAQGVQAAQVAAARVVRVVMKDAREAIRLRRNTLFGRNQLEMLLNLCKLL